MVLVGRWERQGPAPAVAGPERPRGMAADFEAKQQLAAEQAAASASRRIEEEA